MKSVFTKRTRRLKRPSGFSLIVIVLGLAGSLFSQANWAVSSSVTFNSGDYIYQQRTDNYYLNAGLRYSAQNWTVSASVPFILQNSAVYQQEPVSLSSNGHGMNNSATPTLSNDLESGIGDIYLYGEYQLWNGSLIAPSVALTSQLKVPTTNRLTLFSTGKYDYGLGLVLRKWLKTFNAFAEISYLRIGDPEEITYLDPIGYGLGIGKFFASGKYSTSIYFKGYSKIIHDVDPPRQLALGFFSMFSGKTVLSFYLIKGLSESSPDFGLSSGIDWKL
ncbi:hypothetical protein ACX8XP_14640 [Calditrichota bacterium LG25]